MRQNSYRWGAFFTLLRAKSPLLQPIVIFWGLGGSGPLVVFWTIFWYILAQQGETLAWEPRFCTRGDSGALLAHRPLFILGGSGPLGPFFGPFWRNRGSLYSLGAPFVHQGDSGALLAHTPSRPSSILGRLWRTPQVAHRLY